MDFVAVVDQVIALLRQRGRVAYRTLKVQFHLDDEALEALKDELLYAHHVAQDEDHRILVWTGDAATPPAPPPSTSQPGPVPAPPQTALPAVASPPDAERRHLTVLFCDLVDSTHLSGQLDPEAYRDIVRAYQQTCTQVIQRFDGYVAQYLGDGLLVYFGYPQAHEDDAHRAVRTGLGILEATETLNTHLAQEQGLRLAVRLGIHTGLVVVGDMGGAGRQEPLALGEVPNVCARLQGLAAPNSIVLSAATYRLVHGYFDCEALGAQTLRGVTEPLAVYRVRGASDAQSRLEIAATRGLTPLVGRASERTLLLERWHQVTEGQGQVLLLSGEAGIGKSRLVQVFKDHVAHAPHTRWECRSSPYYQHTALYPLMDLFQRALHAQEGARAETTVDHLEQLLRPYRLPLEESVPLFASLLSISVPAHRYPPLQLSPQRQRHKTLESLVAILLELAERQPVVFILEDVHWTDPTTLEFLALVLDHIPTAALYMLLTCRPEFQPSWSHRSYLTAITVTRLSREQSTHMAVQIAGGKTFPDAVVHQIVEKTDGVPLFVEEMTKAILESGYLTATETHYEVAGALPALAIPATLHDSLMARLDRLVTAKAVAQYAAVLGRHFAYAVLQAVSQLDEPTLQRELGRLVDAELLYQRGLPPQATYLFKHALIRDIAYESLLRSTRQGYHQRVASVLEAQFPETAATQPELLAHHYMEAGLHAPAAAYWQHAGQRAIERSAHAEAIRHLTAALEGLTRLPETREWKQRECAIQTALGAVYIAAQGWGTANMERAYRRALELGRQLDDPSTLFPILVGLFAIYQVRADYHQAQQQGEELLRLAPNVHDPSALPAAHEFLGECLLYQGQLAVAYEHFTHVLTGVPPTSPRPAWLWCDLRVVALAHQTLTCWLLGYPEQALQRGQETRAAAQELAHPWTSAFSVLLLTTCLLSHCHQDSATVLVGAEALIALADEQGLAALRILGTCWRGWALVQTGQGETGVAQLEEGMAAWEALGGGYLRPTILALLAEVYGSTGQSDQGLSVLAEAVKVADTTGERWYAAELHRLQGVLWLSPSVDKRAAAEICFQQALALARQQQAKSWELRAATSLSRLWQQQGKRDEARELLAPIYGWFTEGFDTADLQEAKALLEELAG